MTKETNKNLIPSNQRSEDERREIARNGGIKSGETRRRKANLRKAVKNIFEMDVPDVEMKDTLESMGVDASIENALVIALVKKGLYDDDVRAISELFKIADSDKQDSDVIDYEADNKKLKDSIMSKLDDFEKRVKKYGEDER